MQRYPSIRYHKEHAPEGLFVVSAEHEPTGEGWVRTPEAFSPSYVAPPPRTPEEEAAWENGEPEALAVERKPYPSHRYNRQGEVRVVATAEADAALDSQEWRKSSDPAHWAEPAAAPPSRPPASAEISDDDVKAMYGAPQADVIAKISSLANAAMLEKIGALEAENPRGARKTIVHAVKARLAELKAPVE